MGHDPIRGIFSKSHGSGRVGSGRVGSGRVPSGDVLNLTGRVGWDFDN